MFVLVVVVLVVELVVVVWRSGQDEDANVLIYAMKTTMEKLTVVMVGVPWAQWVKKKRRVSVQT